MEPTTLASLATDTSLRVSAAVFRVWLRVCPLVLPEMLVGRAQSIADV